MKRAVFLAIWAAFGSSLVKLAAQPHKDAVDYVSPNIGGVGILLTSTIPYVQLPHGMARLYPITTPGTGDRYLADKIYGFPAGPAMLMASVGPVSAKLKPTLRTSITILKPRLPTTTRQSSRPRGSGRN